MAIDPFQFFQIGQSIGQARSPVAGVGGAIRNVLDQANKVGLLNAQSNAQTQDAFTLAKEKSSLIPALAPEDPQKPIVKDIGGIPHVLSDVIQEGKVVGKKWQSTRTPSLFETFDPNNNNGGNSGSSSVDKLPPEITTTSQALQYLTQKLGSDQAAREWLIKNPQ